MPLIALIEDNTDNRLLLLVILEGRYELVEYETGIAGLEGMLRELPDLVLLDISLPEVDGLEVLRRIRGNSRLRDLPVVALTAHAMAGDRERLLAAGFDDYIAKPIIDEKVLFDSIEGLLSRQPDSETRS